MNFLHLVLRWAHIFSAITLVGGLFFLHFVWLPSTKELGNEEREASFQKLRAPWSKIVMICTLFLLVSGLANAVIGIKENDFTPGAGLYAGLVMVKLGVAFVLFFFTARISGRSAKAVKFRENLPKWLSVTTTLSLVLVLTAGYMKMVERKPKEYGTAPQVEANQDNSVTDDPIQ